MSRVFDLSRVVVASSLLAFLGCNSGDPTVAGRAEPSREVSQAEVIAPPATPPRAVVEIPAHAQATPVFDDWLLWVATESGWRTRWISIDADVPSTVVERDALVVSDGQRMWRVERNDRDLEVLPCECLEGEPPVDCAPHAKIAEPGLRAIDLDGGASTELIGGSAFDVTNDTGTSGEGIYLSLEILGGVDGALFIRSGFDGFFCGVHELAESRFSVIDLATGKPREAPLNVIGLGLSPVARTGAAEEMLDVVRECEGEEGLTLADLLGDRMALVDFAVSVADGQPRVTWNFEVGVMYICSRDYAAHGAAHTGLVDVAEPVGLAGPLPKGVVAAMADLGDGAVVGWGKLSLRADARAAALQRFKTAVEAPWPSETAEERSLDPTPELGVKQWLARARKATHDGDTKAAVAAFDAAIAADASLAAAWSGRGYAKMLGGDLDGAYADLNAALSKKKDPKFEAAVLYNLGQIAERRGDLDAARSAYEASKHRRATKQVGVALERIGG